MSPQKKSQGVKSEERRGHSAGSFLPIHLFSKCTFNYWVIYASSAFTRWRWYGCNPCSWRVLHTMKVAILSAIIIQNQISAEMATIVIGGLKFPEITYVLNRRVSNWKASVWKVNSEHSTDVSLLRRCSKSHRTQVPNPCILPIEPPFTLGELSEHCKNLWHVCNQITRHSVVFAA